MGYDVDIIVLKCDIRIMKHIEFIIGMVVCGVVVGMIWWSLISESVL